MISSFNLNDFEMGESQNPPQDTLYFATPKLQSSYPKDIYAIKILNHSNPNLLLKNESNLKHYFQYVRLAYLLKPEGYVKTNNQLLIFMEKMKCDLSEVIKSRISKGQPFNSDEVKIFLKHTTLGLEELEKKSFPHTNIKPTNILQTMKGMYKLSDVGLASNKDDDDYKAPELLNYPSKDMQFNLHKADIFSLGLIILQLVALKNVKEIQIFKSNSPDSFREIEETFNDIKQKYGRPLQKILKDMLTLNDVSRKTITQMKEDLEDYFV